MPEEKPRTVDEVFESKMFLTMLLLNPTETLKSYGIKTDTDVLVAIEKAADAELGHWKEVVAQVRGARGDICNVCSGSNK